MQTSESIRARGRVNIEVAKHLWRQREVGLIGGEACEINHIIIGRLYYGLYLLAKAKLTETLGVDEIDGVMYKHKPYLNRKTGFQVWNNVIWNELAKVYNDSFRKVFIYNGLGLAEQREKFEYSGHNCSDKHLKKAYKYFISIYRILR